MTVLVFLFAPCSYRNLARGNTIVISPKYELNKNKLYRSLAE